MVLSIDWNRHIETWQQSGLSQAAYCRQQSINYSSFTARLSAYRKQPAESRSLQSPAAALIPVQVQPATGMIRLITAQGHRVELPASIASAWLAELLRCLA